MILYEEERMAMWISANEKFICKVFACENNIIDVGDIYIYTYDLSGGTEIGGTCINTFSMS